MIKTLIFDFGDVFINLDKKGAMKHALDLFRLNDFTPKMNHINELYEQGKITSDEFISFYLQTFPYLTKHQIVDAWNFILNDFPEHRLKFAEDLASKQQYQLILLSNTNELHIKWIQEQVGFYNEFKNCFHRFYLSHEIGLRKPNRNIFQFVLDKNKLNANECLFIDDTKDNIITAEKMGFHVWNIDETSQDITDLFSIKQELF